MPTAIRVIYALAIGVFVVLTVGFGGVTFFPGPESPDFDTGPRPVATVDDKGVRTLPTEAELEAQRERDDAYDEWRDERDAHHRRMLAGVVVAGGLLILAGVAATALVDVLRIGFMLGGLFTVLWGLAAFSDGVGSGARFAVALLTLAVLASLAQPGIRKRVRNALRISDSDDLLPS
ncbi:MAG TPA: hypothetical protein QF624_02610 [Dehalococcoidia bacterium]|nr:hypothetical protein [Dehalococcoidia bacterium]